MAIQTAEQLREEVRALPEVSERERPEAPEVTIEGNTLIIRCDISTAGVRSKTGKSLVICSTSGFSTVGRGFRLSLNLIK